MSLVGELALRVNDNGTPRDLETDDFKTSATGAATQTTLAELLAANHADLAAILAKITADPATETTLAAIQALIGTAVSDSVLSVLRDIASNTNTAAVDVAQLNLTADQVQLNTDTVEAKLDTLHTDIATTLLAKNEAIRALLAGTLLVDSAEGATFELADTTFTINDLPLPDGAATENTLEALLADSTGTEITASTRDGEGNLTAYTERRPSDGMTRDWTITRNLDGTLSTATVTTWA